MDTLSDIKPVSWIKGIVYGFLLAFTYSATSEWLVGHHWAMDDFSYGYIVPAIVLYLIWEKRAILKNTLSVPSWNGSFAFGTGVILYWLGELAGEYFTQYISFWLLVVGLCWFHLGWKKLKTILFPLIFMLSMFPPPDFIYNRISVMLKLISSQIGVTLIRYTGMSVHREGNVIDLGFTQLQVVDACSGLRYLFPLIVLGILLAYFFKSSWWKKTIIVISTIPISIIVNGLRIASVGILYKYWGKAVAEGFFHDFSGWFIFMFSLGILLMEMWVLKKIFPEKSSPIQRDPQITEIGADGEEKRIYASKLKIQNLFSPPQFLVAVILLIVSLVLSQGIEFREKIPINKPFAEFPMQVGKWTGSVMSMEKKFIDTLDLSDYIIVDYKNNQRRNVNFYVAYYESQRKGESIHSPATCLPGSGWIFNRAGKAEIPTGAENKEKMPVNRAIMQKGEYKQLTYYWFPMRGRVLTNAYQMKIYNFWDALTQQRTDGALVRIITRVYENENVEDADKRLQGFMREIVPVLYEYLPK